MKKSLPVNALMLLTLMILVSCTKDSIKPGSLADLNSTPSCSAGPDLSIVLPMDSAILRGSASDPDGDPLEYRWRKISGPASIVIIDHDRDVAQIRSLKRGVYSFELQVTDSRGKSKLDSTVVTVEDASPNIAPIAYAGADQTILLPLDSLQLTGSGTDADGTIVEYKWNITGYYSQLSRYGYFSYTTASVKMNNLQEGMYWCSLTVTDNKGLSASDEVIVVVVSANCPCYPYPCDLLGDPCNPWDY